MTDTAELTDRALDMAARAARAAAGPSYETCRQHLNDVGISRAAAALREAPDLVANARLRLAEAREAEAQAKAVYLTAVTEAEWLGRAVFEWRSNKNWLAVADDGTPIDEADQVSFTADAMKAYIADRAAKTAEVRTVQVALSGAERARAAAADDLAVAEMRFTAAKHLLDAAAAELSFLGLALRTIPAYQES